MWPLPSILLSSLPLRPCHASLSWVCRKKKNVSRNGFPVVTLNSFFFSHLFFFSSLVLFLVWGLKSMPYSIPLPARHTNSLSYPTPLWCLCEPLLTAWTFLSLLVTFLHLVRPMPSLFLFLFFFYSEAIYFFLTPISNIFPPSLLQHHFFLPEMRPFWCWAFFLDLFLHWMSCKVFQAVCILNI